MKDEREKKVSHIGLTMAGSPTGKLVPLFFTFAGKTTENNYGSDTLVVRWQMTDNGWPDVTSNLLWLDLFIEHMKRNDLSKALLFVDGARENANLAFLEKCIANKITLVSLLPGATGVQQPADQLFGPLQNSVQLLARNDGVLLSYTNVAKFWERAVLKMSAKTANAERGGTIFGGAFERCFLVPFVANGFTAAQFASADARLGLHADHPAVTEALAFDPATVDLAFSETLPSVLPHTAARLAAYNAQPVVRKELELDRVVMTHEPS